MEDAEQLLQAPDFVKASRPGGGSVTANNLSCKQTRDQDKQIVTIQLDNLVFTSLKEEVQIKLEPCARKLPRVEQSLK